MLGKEEKTRETRSPLVSVIVPVHNGEKVIDRCLRAIYESTYRNFEVVVVDDCSTDGTLGVVERYPVKLVSLKKHAGVSKARNLGAESASGEFLVFIDADCILQRDTLELMVRAKLGGKADVIGGTYTLIPYDAENFFSTFQSIYVNYCETRNWENPDYVATHCMGIDASLFREFGGFIEDSYIGFAASVEDVELSHRLRREGYRLMINPEIQVKHVFNFSLFKSLKNAAKKSMYWTMYSLDNKDLTKDSGAASRGLKINVACFFITLALLGLFLLRGGALLYPVPLLYLLNLIVNRGFIRTVLQAKGPIFALKAVAYYTWVYPMAVGLGGLIGLIKYMRYTLKRAGPLGKGA